MLTLFNTLKRTKESFQPIEDNVVRMYTCGPTVYNYVHIGNLRTYVFEDILKRVLVANGYEVRHVMNITDVGHLTDDADQGEDKMEKGSKREGKSAWDIAAYYTDAFLRDIDALNILHPDTLCKATDNIPEQIAMVQALVDKGVAYETDDGIYFDTTKIDDYGKLAQLDKQSLKAGARVDLGQKKNPHDFALWKFSPAGEKRQMEWEAFGKKGFPGWHIECSAMSIKYLGEQFDIHCGGIDHVPVHHTNEIAQSETVTGKKPWVTYWLHGEFLNIANPATAAEDKMSKSGENFITLEKVMARGISPLAYRYFLLQAHYRKQLAFSWEALEAAEKGLDNLREHVRQASGTAAESDAIYTTCLEAVNDDLNTSEALAALWKALKENRINTETVLKLDTIFGLDLGKSEEAIQIPSEIQALVDARAEARQSKNWAESDRLRDAIAAAGFTVEDTADGQKISKR